MCGIDGETTIIDNFNIKIFIVQSTKASSSFAHQFGRSKNANFCTSKNKNEKSWIFKTVYGKHSIYFSDF